MAYSTANAMAAGRRVYNGGSDSANRGRTLDPSGYIGRSRMQQAAQMFGQPQQQRQSTSRSGLAAGVTNKMQQYAQQRAGGTGIQSPGTQPMQQRDPDVGGLAPLNFDPVQAANARLRQTEQMTGVQPGYGEPANQAQGNPFVNQIRAFDTSGPEMAKALAAAKIQGVPSSVTGKLVSDLDRDLRYQQQSGYNELTDMIGELLSQQGEVGAQYQQDLRDLGTEQDQSFRDLAARFAAMGGGPGTGYGTEYKDLATEYANFRNDLDSWFTRGQQDFTRERTSGIRDFETLLSHLKGTQKDRDAKEAAEKRLKEKREAEARKKAEDERKKAAKKSRSSSPRRSSRSNYSRSSGGSYRSAGNTGGSYGYSKPKYNPPRKKNKTPTRVGAIKGKKGSRKQYRGGGHFFE